MRLLIITQWYSPEPANLLPEFAQQLRAEGHEVTVLTGYPNYPAGKLYPGYRIRLWQRETIDGVPVIRVPLYPYHGRSPIGRAVNLLSLVFFASLLGPFLIPRVDLIHIRHFHLAAGPAWLLSRIFRIPFTYEIQDIWPEALAASGMLKNRSLLSLIGWYARRVYRSAAAIRVISPGFRRNLVSKGVPEEKIHVISNWVDAELYRPVPRDEELARELGLAGRFNVMYAGNIGLAQGLETALDAAELLRDEPQVQLVFVGDGANREPLEAEAARRGLDNVKFLGRYPGEAMSGLYALADVLLIHLRDEPLFRLTIPHKVFAYLASAKPVLAAVPGDVEALIQSARAGLTCRSGDPAAMAETVRAFLRTSPKERTAMAERGRLTVCERFNREQLIGQIVEMMEAAIEPNRAEQSAARGASAESHLAAGSSLPLKEL